MNALIDTDDVNDDPLEYPGFARAFTAGFEVIDGYKVYSAKVDPDGGGWVEYEVDEDEYRIVDQYEAARRRQAEAQALTERRWKKPEPERRPPDPLPTRKLTGRQEEFCQHYAVQPVAARAAALAGFAEGNAANQGYRLLNNPVILDRIAQLRAERNVSYVIEADTLHDKIEAVFFDACAGRNHAAAISALRLQAGLARLPTRPAAPHSAAGVADGAPKPKRRRPARKAEKSRVQMRKKPRKADK